MNVLTHGAIIEQLSIPIVPSHWVLSCMFSGVRIRQIWRRTKPLAPIDGIVLLRCS
jgi:hypothetical protein